MLSPLMTTTEVAGYLRTSKWTVYELARNGHLEATRVGREWRFTEEQVIRFLALSSSSHKAKVNKLLRDKHAGDKPTN